MSREDDRLRAELADLKRERKMLMEMYGDRGQKHRFSAAIGGLNPAAVELHAVRKKIAAIEKQLRPERAEIVASTRHDYPYDVVYRGHRGHLRLYSGKWTVIVVEGTRHITVAWELDTKTKARDAFAEWVDAGADINV